MTGPLSLFKALADQNRLRVLNALAQHKELCACQLLELLQIKGGTLSRHMSILLSVGLIQSEKRGKWVYYSLLCSGAPAQPVIEWALKQLSQSDLHQRDAAALEQILSCKQQTACGNSERP